MSMDFEKICEARRDWREGVARSIEIMQHKRDIEYTYADSSKETIDAYNTSIWALKKILGREELFEWCTDCKEYDHRMHCCHRWTKQIRDTVEELRKTKGWEEDMVNMIAGQLNNGDVCYWRVPSVDVFVTLKIGEYAVVQERKGYTIVKVLATMCTEEANVSKFTKGYELKDVIKGIANPGETHNG